jgi:hypothetical protein
MGKAVVPLPAFLTDDPHNVSLLIYGVEPRNVIHSFSWKWRWVWQKQKARGQERLGREFPMPNLKTKRAGWEQDCSLQEQLPLQK